jgi:hypothetical protein
MQYTRLRVNPEVLWPGYTEARIITLRKISESLQNWDTKHSSFSTSEFHSDSDFVPGGHDPVSTLLVRRTCAISVNK